MKNICIAIKDKVLIIDYDCHINNNIKNKNSLVFSEEYINNNPQIVGNCIQELLFNKKITTIVITKFELIEIIKDSLKEISPIETLYVSDENNFTYSAYESIVDLKKFKKVSCYNIPTYMLDLFNKHAIEIESRAEIFFTSNFMEDNNLISYSKIYYKSSLKIAPPLTKQDYQDFESFCKINFYLKTIHFNACSIDAIKNISDILMKLNIENINLIIHDNITSKDIIDSLKKLKKYLAKRKIFLKLKYTEEYVKKNYIKQVIITTLIFCALISLLIAGGSTVYIILNNKESEKNVENIMDKIEEKVSQDNYQKEEIVIPEKKEDGMSPVKEYDSNIIPNMKSVSELNSDTVGWINVSGTNINYPVLQTSNNDFYLNHNFDKNDDYNGWVFMNYQNNPKDLDKNTIIFAHNRYYSGIMFGTLSKLTKKEWYENAKNLPIYFNTMYDELEWEVFSIYRVDLTNDYLQTSFDNDSSFLDFISLLRERSIFQSDININASDKIITLSTCLENDQRLVVHAVLKR